MKKIILFFTIFSLFGCDNNSTVSEMKTNQYKQLFLSLSPLMTNYEFKKTIEKEDSLGNLNEGSFLFPVIDLDIAMKVKKRSDGIRLKGAYKKPYFSLSDKEVEMSSLLANEVVNIFRKKYKEIENVFIPTKDGRQVLSFVSWNKGSKSYTRAKGNSISGLSDYGFKMKEYFFLKDSLKTIIVGYKLHRDDLPITYQELVKRKKLEEKKLNDYLNSSDYKEYEKYVDIDYESLLKSSIADITEDIRTYTTNGKPTTYCGLKLEVDYLFNQDFDNLQKKMVNDSKEYLKSLESKKIEDKKNIIKEDKKKANNLNNL